jgi:alpha-beta hydrolase superfamily lysophospholipase
MSVERTVWGFYTPHTIPFPFSVIFLSFRRRHGKGMAHGGDTMKQDWMTRDGLTMYYELHGSGDPLVLIAGLASDSQSWAPILPALAERFQVVVFDNRGAGRTEPMDARWIFRKWPMT